MLGTKEMVAAMMLAAGEIAHLNRISGMAELAVAGAVIAIGGLYSTKAKFAVTRRKLLPPCQDE